MKYFLARPRGGLNDVLCRIYFALHYAQQTNRTIIIDTEFPGCTNSFGQPFDDIFKLKIPNEKIHLRFTPPY